MPEGRLGADRITCNASISACESGRQWQLSLLLLSSMPLLTIEPGDISFSSAISACAKVGGWQQALQLLSDMGDEKLPPNLIAYNAAISACENSRVWQVALQLLEEICPARTVSPPANIFTGEGSSINSYIIPGMLASACHAGLLSLPTSCRRS